jgi:TusA-related sulfurtransferase
VNEEEPALLVDAVGRLCPMPVILLARRIGEVDVGAVVAVVADDPAAGVDIPAWCRMRGQDYVGARPAGDAVEHRVRRAR